MSIYLALDTATDLPSVALGAPGAAAAEVRLSGRRELSREIEHLVERLLTARGIAVSDLAGVIVADGPGSFTGLRIGIAFAKGLCRAGGLPLLTGPSLLGAALTACGGEGTVLAEYDALRGDVYRAVYRLTGRATSTASAAGESAAGRVEVLAAPALVSSDAPLPALPALLRAGAGHASAASLVRLRGFAGGLARIDAPDRWEPAYGRLAEAEVRRRAGER
jgi:tRNA threonylcarbamoyl adenosine modification protein YeaZ